MIEKGEKKSFFISFSYFRNIKIQGFDLGIGFE